MHFFLKFFTKKKDIFFVLRAKVKKIKKLGKKVPFFIFPIRLRGVLWDTLYAIWHTFMQICLKNVSLSIQKRRITTNYFYKKQSIYTERDPHGALGCIFFGGNGGGGAIFWGEGNFIGRSLYTVFFSNIPQNILPLRRDKNQWKLLEEGWMGRVLPPPVLRKKYALRGSSRDEIV